MSYGPTIELMEEWNARLEACGCCPMPVCPVPSMEIECRQTAKNVTAWWPYMISPGLSGSDEIPTLYLSRSVSSYPFHLGGRMTRTVSTQSETSSGVQYIIIEGLNFLIWNSAADKIVDEWVTRDGQPYSTSTPISIQTWYQWVGLLGGSFYRVREEGFDCDGRTETTAINYGYRDEVADSGTDPGYPSGSGPWGNLTTMSLEGVYVDNGYTAYALTDPITPADIYPTVFSEIESASWSTGPCDGSAYSFTWPTAQQYLNKFGSNAPCPPPISYRDAYANASLSQTRIRWSIPTDFAGTWFLITWDEVFFPAGYNFSSPDAPGNPTPTYQRQDLTWEWTGPGTLGDPDTWRSPWFETQIPSEEGTVHIRNVRYQCYHTTPWGTPPPQVVGLAIDIPYP